MDEIPELENEATLTLLRLDEIIQEEIFSEAMKEFMAI